MAEKAHMVKQVIHYSDGTQTEVNYRGVIKDGVLVPDVISNENTMDEDVKQPEAEVPTEAPAEEASEEAVVVEEDSAEAAE